MNRQIKRIAVVLILLCSFFATYAKKDGTITLIGDVYESLLNTRLPGADVYLMDSTGAVIDSVKAGGMIQYGYNKVQLSQFKFKVPRRTASYTIEVDHEGYEPNFTMVTLDNIGAREVERKLPDILLKKKAKKLGEVTVTATKVKFFNKGDTLVYNADAFQLAEGSMLNALIEQMPGVELKEDGQIFVNGKFVESLLLNGKEFMGSDNKLMLENLGAFTVKDVAVYDKKSAQSEFLGQENGDNTFVMDVRLKKEYANGYVGNIEAGYGSEGKYMGRIFGLKYNATTQFMLYGNINNLNDKRTPGRTSNWSPENMQSGSRREKLIGINYTWSAPNDSWRFQGNTTLTHTSSDDDIFSDVTNFLTGDPAENYTYSFRNERSRNLNIKTYNSYRKTMGKVFIMSSLNGSYRDTQNKNGLTSATFNDERQKVTHRMIEEIYSTSSESPADIVNRNLQTDSTAERYFSIYADAIALIDLPKSSDNMAVSGHITYDNSTPRRFNDQTVNYGMDPTPAHRLSQYTKNHPAHNFMVETETSYTFRFTDFNNIQPRYRYEHKHKVKNSYLYALDRLTDNGVFGVLPSDYQDAFDADNSHEGINRYDRHEIGFRSAFEGNRWVLLIGPTLLINHQSLDYTQAAQNFHITRNTIGFSDYWTSFMLFGGKKVGNGTGARKEYERKLTLSFTSSTTLPEMEHLIDLPDTSNPLFIYEGAPDLKNEQKWKWNLRFDLKPAEKRLMESIVADYNLTTDALVRGYSYDSKTGVRRIRTYNTTGNWDAGLANIFSSPIDRKATLMLSSNTSARYGHASDMIGVDAQLPSQFTVKNLLLTENLKLSWDISGRVNLGAKADVQWRETRSDRKDFRNIHALTANYGVTATARLPLNFAISTDMTMYNRRGYSIAELNTTDCVWNARLSYTADKGRWVFMVDGFDLLHQLSAVNYAVTPQGRTVTYTNVLPRFFMLHIQYKFDILPRKRH